MSHLISGVEIEAALVFHPTPKKIVRPRFKKYLKSSTLEDYLERNEPNKMLEVAFNRYSEQGQQRVKWEKQTFINNKCSQLKKKLKMRFNPLRKQHSVNIGREQQVANDPDNHKFKDFGSVQEGMPQSVDLLKKYKTQLSVKIGGISEVNSIARQKLQYHKWLNQDNKQRNSPNVKKINYILQKLPNQQKCKNIGAVHAKIQVKTQKSAYLLAKQHKKFLPRKSSEEQKKEINNSYCRKSHIQNWLINGGSLCESQLSFWSLH